MHYNAMQCNAMQCDAMRCDATQQQDGAEQGVRVRISHTFAVASSMFPATRAGLVVLRAIATISGNKKLQQRTITIETHTMSNSMSMSSGARSRHEASGYKTTHTLDPPMSTHTRAAKRTGNPTRGCVNAQTHACAPELNAGHRRLDPVCFTRSVEFVTPSKELGV
jgi:hypothetical protein